jgi:ubiquinone/menaquinone biosynthesis C-methylase UbiE
MKPKPSLDKWLSLIIESQNHSIPFNDCPLPSFPSKQIQLNTTGLAGDDTLQEAFKFYEQCLIGLDRESKILGENSKILDFGVGWGRISRFFLREVNVNNIYGIDVTADFIEICKKSFSSTNFYTTNPLPPTPFASNTFDLIISFSVFSHLSENACHKWIEEFSRILNPGGILAITTRSLDFLNHCESLGNSANSSYEIGLSHLFDDFEKAKQQYLDGYFIHASNESVSGGGAMNSDFYGETLIPKQYAKNAFQNLLTYKNYIYDKKICPQAIIFYQK